VLTLAENFLFPVVWNARSISSHAEMCNTGLFVLYQRHVDVSLAIVVLDCIIQDIPHGRGEQLVSCHGHCWY
jgi:hypothetical protein